MKVLVYGAGAIGSLFAGKLAQSGVSVTVLARGMRLKQIVENGICLRNSITGQYASIRVRTIDSLHCKDIYDYIIVVVQNGQIDDVLPVLAKNETRNIVFVVNNPLGYQRWIDAVGKDRIMIGFPSAGGERKSDGEVNYFIGKGFSKLFQSTTFGELNGLKSNRLLELVNVFRRAGFSPSMSKNMNYWQKTHVAVVVPIGKALYKYNSNNYKLAKSHKTVKLMILATRECFSALKKIDVKITPSKLNFYYLPAFILTPVFMLIMNTKIAEYAMAKHTVVAKDEMRMLEKQFRSLFEDSGIKFPILDSLQ